MIATTNSTEGGTQTDTYQVSPCSPSFLVGLQPQLISFSVANILLSITAFLGNFLILVALNKETSLHPPSKLLYRCLTTTDLLVGLVSQPLVATYCMSLVCKHWGLRRYTRDAVYVSSFALCPVSFLALTAISVNRLFTLLMVIRYIQIVTFKRTCIITATFWILSVAAEPFSISHTRITRWYSTVVILSCSVISINANTKIFRTFRHHQAQVQDHFQQQPS